MKPELEDFLEDHMLKIDGHATASGISLLVAATTLLTMILIQIWN